MSGIDLHAVIAELCARLPLWVGKIYQYDAKTFGIRMNGEERAKYSLLIEAGRRVHCTDSLPPAPPNPSGYSMFLRKYLNGGRVLDIQQYGLQRIFDITVGKSDMQFHLIIELFDEGNLILCDGDYTIIQPLKYHRFKDREVIAGVPYIFPGKDYSCITVEEMKDLFAESDRNLVRTLASVLMLGGKSAEEVCRMAGLDKNMPAADVDIDIVHAGYKQFIARTEENMSPVITSSGCWPFIPGEEKLVQEFDTFNEALDAYYPKTEQKIEAARPKLSKAEIIRKRQQEALKKFEGKIQHNGAIVEAIYGNYGLVEDTINTLERASREMSWQDIESVLKASDLPVAKAIVRVYPAESAVDIDLGMKVKIYVHESVEVNVDRYYGQIKKYKKKTKGAIAAMERMVEKKVVLKKKLVTLKPKWFHRFRWFYTSDGVLVIGGRDAGTNEEIVKKYMEGGDTFVHADVHGGSVVIVKGETECWDEVAQFAASYSNAWKAGHFTADVYAAGRSQVSKTPESGEHVARGSFVIRGERTYYHNVPVGVAIGLQVEPAYAIIGGPVNAIIKRAKHYVVLKPGTYGPNDIAKKIVRELRRVLPEEEWKSLKNVLNTENITAFVPPGNSDMVD